MIKTSDLTLSQEWVELTYAGSEDAILKKWLIQSLEYVTGREKIERIFNEVIRADMPVPALWGLALDKLGIQTHYDARLLKKTPREGPVIFIANHPFGVVDGLILGSLVASVRPEFFFLVNEVLIRSERLRPYLLPVDFKESKEALQTNIESRKRAMERLKAGEALAIFPSGGVATSKKIWNDAEDLEWKRFLVKLIQQTRATVIPLYFYGQNSRLFQIASHIAMPLRLGLLLHEVRNKMGNTVEVAIGDPIAYEEMEAVRKQDLLDYLRGRTFALKSPENRIL